jgi:hypothetical protein
VKYQEATACGCAVLSEQPQGLSPAGLADGLRRLARLAARVEASRAAFIAEAERSAAAHQEGYPSTTAWLMALSGDPAAVCRSRVAVAASLEDMPKTKAAFAAGEVSESRVKLLAQAQAVAPGQFANDEARLVAEASSASSKELPVRLAAWRRATDPAGAEADAERLHELRALYISSTWSGVVHLSGDLDPEGGMVVLAAIRSLSEPGALDPSDGRTPAQRQADALVEMCRRSSGNAGSRLGPRVLVTIPWETLRTGTGVVDTEAGPIGGETARRLCCDATISRVVLDAESVPVEMGRATRVVPPALRRALDLRDRGCAHPNCDVPARWCDAHHIEHWAEGGRTDLANLHLLCRRHHREAHHGRPYPRRQ